MINKQFEYLHNLQKNELKQLRKELSETKDEEEKERTRLAINVLSQRIDRASKMKEKSELLREHRKKEVEMIEQGKKPFYLKKSDQRKMQLLNQYKNLKNDGKLDSFMKKKRSQKESKEKRFLPKSRQN